ncbi:WH2 domain-containing protein [Cardinium endosymbiont of Bemisia tabaci]|uniref:WH2 domain-containing protein n=1 Tax=Cardinium endosymbiont of Bemisia tabaci TaxID=672794 RepID=UPI000442D2FB|nr:WH2 domain-containing protein [Cardinium endosymbiont of Bemisia tabaci]CDG49494.1 WH2 domain containing protein [Cardinium endosymbiont cBtQ1 of Bemisia tabaci]
MAYKFNKIKSFKKGLIGPNILFPAAYLLFSAEICTSSPKHKSRNGIGNGYIATPQVNQTNKIEEISDSAGDALCDDSRQSDPVLVINSAEDDPLLDTDTTILLIEPLKQSVVQDKVKAFPVVTTSSLEENKQEEGSTKSADELRPSPDVLVKDECSEIPIDSEVLPERPKRRLRKSTARSSGTPNQISVNKPNLLHTPSDTNKSVISPILNSAVEPKRPKRRRRKSILSVIVEKNSSNSRLSSNGSSDGHTFVPPLPPPFPSQDNSRSSLNGVGDGNTYPSPPPPPPPPLPVVDNGRPPSNRVGDKSKPLNKIQEKERSKQPQDSRSELLEAIRGAVDLRKVSEKERSKQPQDPRSELLEEIQRGVHLRKVSEKERSKQPQDPRSELLEEIQRGVHLRKVEKKPEEKPLNTKEHSHVVSILARRFAVELSDSDSGTESESENNNDQWMAK